MEMQMEIGFKFNDEKYDYSKDIYSIEDFIFENGGFRIMKPQDANNYHTLNNVFNFADHENQLLNKINKKYLINIIKKLVKDKYFIIPKNKKDYYIIDYNPPQNSNRYDIIEFISNISKFNYPSQLNFEVIYANESIHKNFKFRFNISDITDNNNNILKFHRYYLYSMNLYYEKQIEEMKISNIRNKHNFNLELEELKKFKDLQLIQNKLQLLEIEEMKEQLIENQDELKELKELKKIFMRISIISIVSISIITITKIIKIFK